QMERYDDALTDLTRAIELDPNLYWAIAGRGETYRQMGRYDDALTDLTRAIELEPTHASTILSRGQIYRQMGRYDDALTDLFRTLVIDSTLSWCHYEIAIVMHVLGRPGEQERWQIAAEAFEADIASGAYPIADAQGNLLVMRCAVSDWARATEELEKFLACSPTAARIREALDDLQDVEVNLAKDPNDLRPLRRELEAAVEAAAGLPRPSDV
ncbi:tetratricopeptide repeat protein, partial [Streptomyces sp. 8L]|uniref:tetratricopeptide repeat protein n=1 Tax=Streptomyces sp. 8L TaxID=2877242 RepID=UPI001CD59339